MQRELDKYIKKKYTERGLDKRLSRDKDRVTIETRGEKHSPREKRSEREGDREGYKKREKVCVCEREREGKRKR
jgi:hypothetical protein